MKLTINKFFTLLSAPRSNHVWSWGGIRKTDGAIFLQVWEDKTIKRDGRFFTEILRSEGGGNGWNERARHIEMILRGTPCYLVYCVARDPLVRPRKILTFNQEIIFKGGQLIDSNTSWDGDTWIERGEPVDVKSIVQS
jgi:hypothetical protein